MGLMTFFENIEQIVEHINNCPKIYVIIRDDPYVKKYQDFPYEAIKDENIPYVWICDYDKDSYTLIPITNLSDLLYGYCFDENEIKGKKGYKYEKWFPEYQRSY